MGLNLSRRDDLESAMYIAIRMINSNLPWNNLQRSPELTTIDQILKKKEEYWGEKLTEGLPSNFKELVNIITNMKPEEDPPYDKLIELMRKVE